jgi:hypothetical protein
MEFLAQYFVDPLVDSFGVDAELTRRDSGLEAVEDVDVARDRPSGSKTAPQAARQEAHRRTMQLQQQQGSEGDSTPQLQAYDLEAEGQAITADTEPSDLPVLTAEPRASPPVPTDFDNGPLTRPAHAFAKAVKPRQPPPPAPKASVQPSKGPATGAPLTSARAQTSKPPMVKRQPRIPRRWDLMDDSIDAVARKPEEAVLEAKRRHQKMKPPTSSAATPTTTTRRLPRPPHPADGEELVRSEWIKKPSGKRQHARAPPSEGVAAVSRKKSSMDSLDTLLDASADSSASLAAALRKRKALPVPGSPTTTTTTTTPAPQTPHPVEPTPKAAQTSTTSAAATTDTSAPGAAVDQGTQTIAGSDPNAPILVYSSNGGAPCPPNNAPLVYIQICYPCMRP